MARSLYSYQSFNDEQDDEDLDFSIKRRRLPKKDAMKMSFGQLWLLWSAVLGMMAMVFIFGFHAGREEGVRSALDRGGEQVVRLPVAQPVKIAQGGNAGTQGKEPTLKSLLGKSTAELELSGIGRSSAEQKPKVQEKAEKLNIDFVSSAGLEKAQREAGGSGETTAKQLADGSARAKPKLEALQKTPDAKVDQAPEKISLAKSIEQPNAKAKTIGTDTLKKGWYVQAAASRDSSDAAGVAERLSAKKLPAVIENARVRDVRYYRVLVGPYSDRPTALSAKSSLRKNKLAQGEPFLKFVK